MKHLFMLIACLLTALTIAAQTDSPKKQSKKKERQVQLSGEVYDSFTKAKVKAHITLMQAPDSTVVDTMTCWTWSTMSYYEFKVPARQADFIIKATAEGYRDTTMNYQLRHLARNSYFELPRLLMKKKQPADDDIYKEVGIDGVVITGTKVKLAYRGDTLVYNASAFNLPEGSMLDGLIRQMPGAELKENGDIYINGRKVDYLTLNGKDFFKGRNKVMLDNLPYYTVKELKVYDKSTKESELIGQDVEKKDYVMDVQLKREYNRGYMGNVEVGAGTESRYMGRIFGLYYDDHTRASVFANLNNVNENRTPGAEGDWEPSDMPQGLLATRQAGLHLETEHKDKNWNNETDATLSWSDADNWSRTATERFATEGNILGGSESWSRQKSFSFEASNWFQMSKPFTLWSNIDVSYSNGDRTSGSQDSTWRNTLINRARNDGMTTYRHLSLAGSINFFHKFSWGDNISLGFNIRYNNQKPNESFSLGHTYYAQTGNDDQRHYYNDTHSQDYHYSATARYSLQLLNRWFVRTYVSYGQTMIKDNNLRYRLDWLQNAVNDRQQIGWLPSSRDALASVLDGDNSDTQFHMTHAYGGRLSIMHANDNDYLEISLPIDNYDERIHFVDTEIDTIARRNYTNFTPRFIWSRWGIKHGLEELGYSVSVSRPDMASLISADDTSNPLVTWTTNSNLKNRVTHSAHIAFAFNNDSTRHFTRLWSNASLTRNAWGTRTTYNQTTGGYTYTNDNINGNWYWGMGCSYEQPLDKKKRLTLHQRADAEYTHSVDFDILYATTQQEASESSPKSTVNNWTLHEKLGLEYQKDKLTVGISGDINWRSSTGDRKNFERISAFDYNYGGLLRYFIPWVKLSLGTDIRMYSRRGYNSSIMNTDDLVWNAEVARTLFKEKLTLKLTAFDLLHQLSNKQYSVNAQGRTETWNNCIPRYIMLSAIYKLNIKPKKQ